MNLKRKSFLLTFFLALIPGAGQMYLGYMKRGVSLMGLFFAIFGFSMFFRFEGVLFVLPIIYAYSFFDSFSLRNQTPEQMTENPDDVMGFVKYAINALSGTGGFHKPLQSSVNSLLGWGCVIMGGYMLYDILFSSFFGSIVRQFELWWLSDLIYSLPTLALAFVLVLLGLHLLRGKNQTNAATTQDDYIAYKGDDTHGGV